LTRSTRRQKPYHRRLVEHQLARGRLPRTNASPATRKKSLSPPNACPRSRPPGRSFTAPGSFDDTT
jgi:hypothetical protein